jgi:hypothetical protein
MNQFLRGAIVLACSAIALFYLRYWRATKDRLFLFFCVAFVLFALNWTAISVSNDWAEHAYLARFLAFAIIAWAVIDKNRRATSRRG